MGHGGLSGSGSAPVTSAARKGRGRAVHPYGRTVPTAEPCPRPNRAHGRTASAAGARDAEDPGRDQGPPRADSASAKARERRA
ncbi:predicted protein [Streptomyces viridosporus ATCC 14672]|uniref:Predicted protein n=1 Tax=Streptomyces viridosporus (strain ATCC 14672 / DSM 40746 / JCM 4963 / KCTC 9882 / NRRL B-12104 / FH 1290) TaxID=566461 RepID=D6A683_STRV1|nr:predicted protein [Streptomyces viridosporus ATCC 14672]